MQDFSKLLHGKKADTEPRPHGRRPKYTPQRMARICERLELGESLRAAAAAEGVDKASVRRWCRKDEAVARQYALARDAGLRCLEERLLELLEELPAAASNTRTGSTRVQAIRTEIDSIKWLLCKRYPREFGDSVGGALASPAPAPEDKKWLRRARQQEAANAQADKMEFVNLMRECKAMCRQLGL